MRVSLEGLDPERRAIAVGGILELLARSAFRRPSMRPHAVVVWGPDEKRVMARGCFVGWARSHDLNTVATAALKARVPPRHVLCWFSGEDATGACAELVTLDLDAEVAAVRPYVDAMAKREREAGRIEADRVRRLTTASCAGLA